jgi:hypothetical protein
LKIINKKKRKMISEYFLEGGSSNDVSKIKSAMNQLESNTLTLRQGVKISDISLKSLPSEFLDDWNTIYQKWVSLKTTHFYGTPKGDERLVELK